MIEATKGGHKDLVEFFIQKEEEKNGLNRLVYHHIVKSDATYMDWGMVYAASRGHKHLVDFYIEKGANAWNLAMMRAARGGHKYLVDFFINLGACWWGNRNGVCIKKRTHRFSRLFHTKRSS